MRCKYWASKLVAVVFEYETFKIVAINSKKAGLLCRLVQSIIIAYIIGYVIVYNKGYQRFDNGVSGLITKVKGVSYSNNSYEGGFQVWDVADYVIPPEEKDAFFITTNAIVTRHQRQGICPEDPHVVGSKCGNDSDCVAYDPIMAGNGIKTGKCNTGTNTCEIYAWCPVENSTEDHIIESSPLLKHVVNFTVLVKNTVEFKLFKVIRANIPADYNKTKLATCRYDEVKDKRCPIFTIGTILRLAKIAKYEDIGAIGGVISFDITWNCNIDYGQDDCYPTYSFGNLNAQTSKIAKGSNFRYANYYYENGTQYRDLIKAYGLRFVISVSSKAGQFFIVPLTLAIGSGLALLGIATVICDLFVLYCLKKSETFKEAKYDRITGDDAYEPLASVEVQK